MVVFDSSSRVPKQPFDITGRVLRRGVPAAVPSPLGGSPGSISEFVDESEASPPSVRRDRTLEAAAYLSEQLSLTGSGIHVVPQEHCFVGNSEEERRLYAGSALLIVLGGGYL